MELIQAIDLLFEEMALNDNFIERELSALSLMPKEVESVIFLKDNQIIQNKRFDIGFGDYKSVHYSVQDILNKAKEFGANVVINVHNHPNETAHPSQEDINSFKAMLKIMKDNGIGLRAYVVAGRENAQKELRYSEYDEFTSPELHTQDFIYKGKDIIQKAVQSHGIKVDDKDVENKLSGVKNITDFEKQMNSILLPFQLKFVPKGIA